MTSANITTPPAPLTPADCNLQDFAFMPLDVARLRDSDMAAYESPEACWAAVLLWSAAWHQVPAASLPDDDRFLAKAAGYGRVVKEWANVRDGALHGWIKCADGRLYHPVVAEKALESWKAKVHHAWKKECDRIRKANKQREAEGHPPLPFPLEPGSVSVNLPPEMKGIPKESVVATVGNTAEAAGIPPENALKGEGEGQGELTTTPIPPGGGSVRPKEKATAIALQTFLDDCDKKGERPLRDYTPLWEYTQAAGLTQDLVTLAWIEFKRRFGPGGTKQARRQKNWRQTFRNYVENNFLRLWYVDGNGQYALTTQGKQAKMAYESKEPA